MKKKRLGKTELILLSLFKKGLDNVYINLTTKQVFDLWPHKCSGREQRNTQENYVKYCALPRLIEKGYVQENGKSNYSITDSGKQIEKTVSCPHLPSKSFSKKTWNKKWTLVLFDIPEGVRLKRDVLRSRLQELGFKCFHQSVWISPVDYREEVLIISEAIECKNNLIILRTCDEVLDLQIGRF